MTPAAVAVAQMVAAGAAVAGTAISIKEGKDAREDQLKQQRVQERIADVEAQRKRNLALRSSRIQRARIENVAAQTGTSGSAGAIGAVQSIGSQTNANLSFLDTTKGLAGEASGFAASAASHQSKALTAQAIGSVGMKFADFGAFIKE